MNKKYNYFDDGKSLVENGYYLLMILSIVFVAIQVIIARNSLDHNANLELTKHTVEQDNHYRVTIEANAEKYVDALQKELCDITGRDPYSVLLSIDSLMMWQGNLEEMTLTEGMTKLLIIPESLMMNDPWWLVIIKVVLLFVVLLVWTIFNVWYERRLVGKMQHRLGPIMNGPLGLGQETAHQRRLHATHGGQGAVYPGTCHRRHGGFHSLGDDSLRWTGYDLGSIRWC